MSLVVILGVASLPGVASASCPSPGTPECPAGTTYEAGADRCEAPAYPCLPGYEWNASSGQCEVTVVASTPAQVCPAGSSYSALYGKCETANLGPCAAGFTYNGNSGKCEVPATFVPAESCPEGYTFDSAANKCKGGPDSACIFGGGWGYYEETCVSGSPLPGFNWDGETGLYIGSWQCPAGYSVSAFNGECSGPKKTAVCPEGSIVDPYTSKCEMTAGPVCAAGQVYNLSTKLCDFAPVVSPAAPTCPPDYTLNVDTSVCMGAANSACPPGSGYGYYEEMCVSGQALPGFSWDPETLQYVGDWHCPPGFGVDVRTGACFGPACPAGEAYDPVASICQPSGCPAGTELIGNLCVAVPACMP